MFDGITLNINMVSLKREVWKKSLLKKNWFILWNFLNALPSSKFLFWEKHQNWDYQDRKDFEKIINDENKIENFSKKSFLRKETNYMNQ